MRRILLILCAILILPLAASANRTFYISTSGSNSNSGTSQGSPWKSHPAMKHVSGCDGAVTPSYTHQAGDQFIFKGGDSWPAACFGMTLNATNIGGTSSAQDYIGACVNNTDFAAAYPGRPLSANLSPCASGTSWPSSGWTRPKFDLGGGVVSTSGGFQVIFGAVSSGIKFFTIDDIEIANQGIGSLTSGATTSNQAAISLAYTNSSTGSSYDPGTIVQNMYLHGAVTSIGTYTKPDGTHWASLQYAAGGVDGAQFFEYSEINGDDASNGGVTPTTTNWYFFMGSGQHNQVMAYNKIHGTINGCDQDPVSSGGGWVCHDNEIYHVSNAGQDSFNGGVHSHVIFDEQTVSDNPGADSWNNAIHDTNAGLTIAVNARAHIFNNVLWNNLSANGGIRVQRCGINTQTCPATDQLLIWNNTISDTHACINSPVTSGTAIGSITIQNNICIGAGISVAAGSHTGTLTEDHNSNPMPSSEASQYGFVATNLFSPSSSDPNVSSAGVNLTSSCTGNITALCLDTSGAPWFGGSYKSRPTGSTGWDLGAYQGTGGGGSPSPPIVVFASPTCGVSCTGTQTLTVTATPQGSATISSCQFTIDGFTFGSPDTTSPYTTTWDTTTASNNRAHAITASCTDSNGLVGTAGPVNATPTNSHPNGFVSDHLWSPSIPSQSFTPQTSGTVTYTGVCIKPYTSTTNDNEVGLSSALPTGYGDFAAIIAVRAGGFIQVYDGTLSGGNPIGYTTDSGPTAFPATAATKYCFNWTINLTTQQHTVVETSPSSATIATNFGFRDTTDTSIGFLSAYSTNNSTPDTVEVSGFTVPSTPALSFSPGDLSFGNVTNLATAMLTESVTIANPPATISSAAVSGTGFSLDASSTCPNPSGSLTVACTYVVDFTPPSSGPFTGTLTITGTQTGSPQVFNLSGTGVPSSPATVTFSTNASNPVTSIQLGSTQIHFPGATTTITCSVVNGPATITPTLTGGDAKDFQIIQNGCNGSISSTGQEIVQFTPHRFGSETTTLAFAISGQATQNVTLDGTCLISTQITSKEQ